MAYRSLFTPISQEELQNFNTDHDIKINEDIAPQAATPMPQQPAAPAQPAPAQPGQQPSAPQAATPAQQGGIDLNMISQLGKNIQASCPAAAQDQGLLTIWKTLQAQPTPQNLMTYMSAFAKFAGQQAASQAPQGQPAAPAQAAPAQNISNSLRPKSAWALIREKVKYNRELRALHEAEEAKANDGSDDEKPAKAESKSSQSSKTDDFNDDKNVDYAGEYDEQVSGKKGTTTVENKDKVMYDSIFGSKDDPFADSKEVSYHNAYNETGDRPTERDQNTTLTKAEPFKPENPKLTTLSDASAVSKTVFTIDDNGNIKDTGASSDSKKVQDDGSEDDDMNEGFTSKIPGFIRESIIDSMLKKTILNQYSNIFGEDFDPESFSDWLQDEYPSVASDPSAFDAISQAIQNGEISEEDTIDDDIDDREPEGDDDDFKSDDDYEDAAHEYIEDTDLEDYDEDDDISWCEEHYPEIASDDASLDDFLDAVCDMFVEDDLNESINDEYYAKEKEIND